MRRYYLCVYLMTMSVLLLAQTPVQVGRGFEEEVLSKQVDLLEDVAKNLTIRDVLAQQSLFKPNNQPFINPGFTNSYYWIRFQLTNPDSVQQDLILEVENPHINKLQLFTVLGKHVSASRMTGNHFPLHNVRFVILIFCFLSVSLRERRLPIIYGPTSTGSNYKFP